MPDKHDHQWQCYADNPSMLECTVPVCNTVARIGDLLRKTEHRGIERGRHEICVDLLRPNAMLTRRGRVAVNNYVARHPLTRMQKLDQAGQVPLIPTTIKKEK